MKVIAVRNHLFRDTIPCHVDLSFDEATQDLTVSARSVDPLIEYLESDRREFKDTTTVNLNELRARRDWCEHQVYFLAMEDRKFVPVFSLYDETLPRREGAVDYATRLQRRLLVGINVPFTDSTNDEVFLTVNMMVDCADSDLTVTGLVTEWSEAAQSGTERVLRLPHIRAIAPATMAPDSTASVQVRVEDVNGNLIPRNCTVYVEAVSGFAGGTRVSIVNGVGVLPVSSAGMPAGSTLRMKLGWKYYVGVEDAIISVA